MPFVTQSTSETSTAVRIGLVGATFVGRRQPAFAPVTLAKPPGPPPCAELAM